MNRHRVQVRLGSTDICADFVFSPGLSLAITLGTTVVFTVYGLFIMLRVAERPFDDAHVQAREDEALLQAA